MVVACEVEQLVTHAEAAEAAEAELHFVSLTATLGK